ncbi:hypothetical protein J6590_025500 [Homalodisca vitripennis]|nr:hypothetical protein J6590_025500 [Homalodisca vitripennis]
MSSRQDGAGFEQVSVWLVPKTLIGSLNSSGNGSAAGSNHWSVIAGDSSTVLNSVVSDLSEINKINLVMSEKIQKLGEENREISAQLSHLMEKCFGTVKSRDPESGTNRSEPNSPASSSAGLEPRYVTPTNHATNLNKSQVEKSEVDKLSKIKTPLMSEILKRNTAKSKSASKVNRHSLNTKKEVDQSCNRPRLGSDKRESSAQTGLSFHEPSENSISSDQIDDLSVERNEINVNIGLGPTAQPESNRPNLNQPVSQNHPRLNEKSHTRPNVETNSLHKDDKPKSKNSSKGSRPQKNKILVGTASSPDLAKFFGAKKAWFHLGKVAKGTKEEDIKDFVSKTFPNMAFSVDKLESKGVNESFKLGVEFLHKDTVMDGSCWPKNVTLKRFLFLRTPKPLMS